MQHSMTALTALASATIVAPGEAAIPPQLEAAVRQACAGAWRAVEVVLTGDVLRGRLGKTRDTYVRDAVEAVLALFGGVAVRPEPLTELRAARKAGSLTGDLDLAAIAARVRTEGAAAVSKHAVATVRRQLAEYPALEAALAEPELATLLVDAARALFRNLARDPVLAGWAIGPTGIAARDRALVAFAELVGSPASVDELETLIALPIHLDENVQFTVYRPRAIDPGRWHPLLAFAHLADRRPDDDAAPDPIEEVRRQARSVLGERAAGYQPVTQDSGSAIPADGELVFVPEIAGVEFNPPRRSFLWLEAVHREEFRMRAGDHLDGKTARGRLTVFLGHIAIAEIPLSVRVDQRPEPTVREPVHARAYRKIFASYSHRDVAIVNQFETYARALGDEYLRDWIHLRTGEVWNDRLRQLIENADAFQLFWSWNSMHSKFVRQEYEHALALNRPSFVRPTYWEDPMPSAPGLPPEALLRLHFQKLGGAVVAAQRETDSTMPDMAVAPAELAMEHELEVTAPHALALRREEAPTSRSRAVPRPAARRQLDDDEPIEPPSPPPAPRPMPAPAPAMSKPSEPAQKHEQKQLAEPEPAPKKIPATRPSAAPPPPKQVVPSPIVAPARPSASAPAPSLAPRVICDNCGHENATHVKFCMGCGTTLAAPRASTAPLGPAKTMMAESAPSPPAPAAPGPAAPKLASARREDPDKVSPYAATVPQQAYAPPPGHMPPQTEEQKARRPDAPSGGARWIIAAVLAVLVIAAVIVYLMLR